MTPVTDHQVKFHRLQARFWCTFAGYMAVALIHPVYRAFFGHNPVETMVWATASVVLVVVLIVLAVKLRRARAIMNGGQVR